MATTITAGSLSFTPDLFTGWQATQESRNVIHAIIGRTYPDVTLKPAQVRTGTLEMFFAVGSESFAARSILASGAVFTITSDETPWIDGLTFVLSGSILSALNDDSRSSWMLSADFQEVIL
jgi:hypothetical protein